MSEEHVLNKKLKTTSKPFSNNVISESFSKIINENEQVRIKNSAVLINHLLKREKEQDDLNYSLKRLIRGVGSSTSTSRAGFFTTLVAYFKIISNDLINILQIFKIVKKELIVGGSEQDKMDAYIGRILVCGALIKSEKLINGTNEEICECLSMLINASKQKKFHSSLAFTFLVDLQSKLKKATFKQVMWPILQEELMKPWKKQTIDTVYFIFAAKLNHSSVVAIQPLLGYSDLICEETFSNLGTLLLNAKHLNCNHPIYEVLAEELANSKFLLQFWSFEIEKRLKSPTIEIEIIILKIVTIIFEKSSFHNIDVLSEILSKNFVTLIISTFTNKNKKDNFVKDFYNDFFESIINYVKRQSNTESKINLIKKIILHPGILMFDKITSSNVVANIFLTMHLNDVKEITEFYKKIITNDINIKKQIILDSDKIFALKTIQKLTQHNSVLNDFEWRTEQLIFIFNLSVFHTNDGIKLSSTKNENQLSNVLNYFYQCLEIKFPKLENERDVLLALTTHANKMLSKKNFTEYLRIPFVEETKIAWKNVYQQVTIKNKNSNKQLKLVFDILLMHMGLQLFNDQKLAFDAIQELNSCMERVTKKSSNKKFKNNNSETEPEWIEVIIDLFLHLLSQNSSLLRNIIAKVFPSLCSNMTLSAIHQILSVLNISDDINPLSYSNELESGSDDEDENNEIKDDDNDDDDNDDDDDDDDDEESNNEDDYEHDLDEGNVSEQLRSAVTTALKINTMHTDDESIDLNDIDEAEANKLNDALSMAFKLYSENKTTNKKSKKEKFIKQTVEHFRMRVLDLIEIYTQHNPKMSFILEILLSFFEILPYCIKDNNTLLEKVKNLLNKIVTIRQFDLSDGITNKNLAENLTVLMEKKFSAVALQERNFFLTKCAIFIIHCSQKLEKENENDSRMNSNCLVTEVYEKYLQEFIDSNNPAVPLNLYTVLFGIVWNGLWKLTNVLIKKGLNNHVKSSIRRSQIIGLLTQLYNNIRFIQSDLDNSNIQLKKIEQSISSYISSIVQIDITEKTFNELLELLIKMKKCHSRVSELKTNINWENIGNEIQSIRKKFVLQGTQNLYKTFCNSLKINEISNDDTNNLCNGDDTPPIKKSSIPLKENLNKKEKLTNGNKPLKNGKRKAIEKDSSNVKKQKKEARIKASSMGIDNHFSFSNIADISR